MEYAPEDPGLERVKGKQFNHAGHKYWLCACGSFHKITPYKCPYKTDVPIK